MEKNRKPSSKQLAFVQEYIIDFNGAKAAVRAGYAKKSSKVQAARLLTNDNLVELISQEIEKRNARIQVDQDYVLHRLVEIDKMDVIDIMKDDGSLKPLSEWPKIWREMIQSMDLAEMFDGVGDDRTLVGIMKKIKWPDKVKNLEMLGKHVAVNAWREVKEVKVEGEVDVNHQGELPEVLQRTLDAVYKQGRG